MSSLIQDILEDLAKPRRLIQRDPEADYDVSFRNLNAKDAKMIEANEINSNISQLFHSLQDTPASNNMVDIASS